MITASGGIYKTFIKEKFPLVTCKERIVERTKFNNIFGGHFPLEQSKFNVVNHYLDDTMTCFDELQFVQLKDFSSLSQVQRERSQARQKERALCISDRLYFEGDVEIAGLSENH